VARWSARCIVASLYACHRVRLAPMTGMPPRETPWRAAARAAVPWDERRTSPGTGGFRDISSSRVFS
jgi:hypothetical protein